MTYVTRYKADGVTLSDAFVTDIRFSKRYIGLKEKDFPKSNGNKDIIFILCFDGLYRNETNKLVLNQYQIDNDLKQSFLKELKWKKQN